MTNAELGKIVDALRESINKTLDKVIEKADRVELTLVTYDGRLKRLEENDTRRQKITDSLTAGVGLVIVLEVLRYVFTLR